MLVTTVTRLTSTRQRIGENISAQSGLTKVLAELVGVQRGAHEHDLEVVSVAQQILHDGEEDVRVQTALVDLVENQVTDAGQTPEAHDRRVCAKKQTKKM